MSRVLKDYFCFFRMTMKWETMLGMQKKGNKVCMFNIARVSIVLIPR
jgi:hypothetical protein